MKILFVQKEGGIFGAENYQLNVIPGLISKGVEIEFLRLYTNYQGGIDGEFVERLKGFHVKVYQVNIGKIPTISTLRDVHRIVIKGQFNLVHTHLIHADFYLALTKTVFRGKYRVVSTKHGYDNAFTSKYGFDASKQKLTPYFVVSRWAEKRMWASFTISHGLRNFFIETGLTTSNRMSLVQYGFDMPENYLLKGDPRFRKSQNQIFIAGRLVKFKGHNLLIKAMKNVIEAYSKEVKLLIAGIGNEEDNLRKEVQLLGIQDNVEFIGFSKDIGAYMANSDAIVVPSISEGFGVVFLEAFSAKPLLSPGMFLLEMN